MTKLIGVVLVVGLLAAGGVFLYKNGQNQPKIPDMKQGILSPAPQTLGGNDRDEHGCIGSAGYRWCDAQQKCLRPWEEVCEVVREDVGAAIEQFLAKKYVKPLNEVTVTVSKHDGNYATGGVKFGAGGVGEGGLWLGQKTNNEWEVVWDGNGMIDCEQFKKDYSFPKSVLGNFCD